MPDPVAGSQFLISSAERLSAMADKVAGFAIGANLLLIFACLKDLGPWVQREQTGFLVGIGAGCCCYSGAVWLLLRREKAIRADLKAIIDVPPISEVCTTLAAARILGIAAFSAVNMLAVIAAAHGSGPKQAMAASATPQPVWITDAARLDQTP